MGHRRNNGNGTGNGKPYRKTYSSGSKSVPIRSYQSYAAMYPPLPHERMILESRKFVRGRDAKVELLEEERFAKVLDDDWSDSNIIKHKEEVIDDIKSLLDKWTPKITTAKTPPEETRMPKDEWDKLKADDDMLLSDYLATVKSRHHTDKERLEMDADVRLGEQALDTMVKHNLQLAMSRVGKMKAKNSRAKKLGFSELLSVANIGLVLGARQFDPEKGNRFSTYAPFHIDGQLYDYLQVEDGNTGIKSSTGHEMKQILEIKQVSETYTQRYGMPPTIQEMQSITGIACDIIKERMSTVPVSTQSIFVQSSQDGDDKDIFLPDLLDSSDAVARDIEDKERHDKLDSLHKMLSVLSPDEYRVIAELTGMEPDMYGPARDAPAIARDIGIPLKDCRDIMNRALRKLRLECEYSGIDFSDIINSNEE